MEEKNGVRGKVQNKQKFQRKQKKDREKIAENQNGGNFINKMMRRKKTVGNKLQYKINNSKLSKINNFNYGQKESKQNSSFA